MARPGPFMTCVMLAVSQEGVAAVGAEQSGAQESSGVSQKSCDPSSAAPLWHLSIWLLIISYTLTAVSLPHFWVPVGSPVQAALQLLSGSRLGSPGTAASILLLPPTTATTGAGGTSACMWVNKRAVVFAMCPIIVPTGKGSKVVNSTSSKTRHPNPSQPPPLRTNACRTCPAVGASLSAEKSVSLVGLPSLPVAQGGRQCSIGDRAVGPRPRRYCLGQLPSRHHAERLRDRGLYCRA